MKTKEQLRKEKMAVIADNLRYAKEKEAKLNDDKVINTLTESAVHENNIERIMHNNNKGKNKELLTSKLELKGNVNRKLKGLLLAEVAFSALQFDEEYKKANEGKLKNGLLGFFRELMENNIIKFSDKNEFSKKAIMVSEQYANEMVDQYTNIDEIPQDEKEVTIKEAYEKFKKNFVMESNDVSRIIKNKVIVAIESEKAHIKKIDTLCESFGVKSVSELRKDIQQKELTPTLLETINAVLLETMLLSGENKIEQSKLFSESLMIYTVLETAYTLKLMDINPTQLVSKLKDINYGLTDYVAK